MSNIGKLIELTSAEFSRCQKDSELVNEDSMYGYALAHFIADSLPAFGFKVKAHVAEDWGWWTGLENDGFELSYGCCCDNESNEFIVHVDPAKPAIRRWFRKIDVSERVEALNSAIFEILASSNKATKGPTWAGF